MFKIYYASFDTQVKLVFEIYDFDRDGFITPEDVRIILSYVPILNTKEVKTGPREGAITSEGGGYEDFDARIKIQEQISEMVSICFVKKEKLNLEEFQQIQENTSSDMLLNILNLLRMRLPCTDKFFQLELQFGESNRDSLGAIKTKKIASPGMRALSPTAALRDENDGFGEAQASLLSRATDDKVKAFQGKVKDRQSTKKQAAVLVSENPESPSNRGDDCVRLANQKGNDGKNRFASPSHFLNPAAAERADSEEAKKDKVHFEGEMMRKAKENKLKKYYYILEDKELYVYKKKTDKTHKTMVNLVGVFI